MQQFFHITLEDVLEGRVTFRHFFACVSQLPRTAGSRLRGDLLGGSQFDSWSATSAVTADLHDLVVAIVAGLAGNKPKPDALAPRPKGKEEERREWRPATIADMTDSAIGQFMSGR